MHTTVERGRSDYLLGREATAWQPATESAAPVKARRRAQPKPPRAVVVKFAVLGAASVLLYVAFFLFAEPLFAIYTGQNALAAVANIGTVLLFCLVYGPFASCLLEILGLKALK